MSRFLVNVSMAGHPGPTSIIVVPEGRALAGSREERRTETLDLDAASRRPNIHRTA